MLTKHALNFSNLEGGGALSPFGLTGEHTRSLTNATRCLPGQANPICMNRRQPSRTKRYYPGQEFRRARPRRRRGGGKTFLGGIAVAVALVGSSLLFGDGNFERERAPQQGDFWSSCASARAAGTAPIFRGEPGYRIGLDEDHDGEACEPYRGY